LSPRILCAASAPLLALTVALSALAGPALAAPAQSAATQAASTPPASVGDIVPGGSPDDGSWQLAYRNDFVDLRDVTRFSSTSAVNDTISPADNTNSLLQKPTASADVSTVADPAATDGSALGVFTQQSTYPTGSGTAYGWTNGRMVISGQNQSPPVRIRARVRMTPSIGAKTAVMWWPAGGGWPWEVDFAETFGGLTMTDHWGSRQTVDQHWHSDMNGDGSATEQLNHADAIDATQYHSYDLFILPNHMWIEIDGVKTFETTDPRWIPKGPGFFSIGKALTGTRSGAHTVDGVFLDSLEIYKPATLSATVDALSSPVGTAPSVTGTLGTGGSDMTYHVDYGPTSAYGASTPNATAAGSALPVPVSVPLAGLAAGSIYHYRLVATNASGSVASSDAVLTTGGVPTATSTVQEMQPTTVLLANVVSTGGLPTTTAVQYSAAGGLAQTTPGLIVPASTSGSTTVTVPLTGLVPGATYSFVTMATNAAGSVTGSVSTFIAPSAPRLVGPATVQQANTDLTVTGAVDSGNLPTTVRVEYGLTTTYGSATSDLMLPAGIGPSTAALDAAGLAPGQRYHYRLVATNAAGTVVGPDALTGTTGAPVATTGVPTRVSVTATSAGIRVVGTIRPNSLLTTYTVRYGVTNQKARKLTAAVAVGSGLWASSVTSNITGLPRHTCYRVQLVATNAAGTSTGSAASLCTG
jgi:hypothetical protein